MHISITIKELIDLAQLGCKYVEEQLKGGTVAWLGGLPPAGELDKAGKNLLALNKGDQVIHLYEYVRQ